MRRIGFLAVLSLGFLVLAPAAQALTGITETVDKEGNVGLSTSLAFTDWVTIKGRIPTNIG